MSAERDFQSGQFIGFVDCGRTGLADRYQDLALASRSVGSNFGSEWVQHFFDAYGVTDPDETKLCYFRLLDEFF
jgi:aminoglycoside phosphotransferase